MPESPSCTEDVKKRRSSRSRRSSRRTSFSLQTFKDDTQFHQRDFARVKAVEEGVKAKVKIRTPLVYIQMNVGIVALILTSSSNGLSQQLLVGLEDTQEAQDNLSYEGSETWFSVKPFCHVTVEAFPHTLNLLSLLWQLLFFYSSSYFLTYC